MGIGQLLDQQQVNFGTGFIERPRAGFGEVMDASFDNHVGNYNINSGPRLRAKGRENRRKVYRDLTGEDLSLELARDADPKLYEQIKNLPVSPKTGNPELRLELEEKLFDKFAAKKRAEDPAVFQKFQTGEEIQRDAIKEAQKRQDQFQRVVRNADAFDAVTGTIVGGIGAAFTDPLNIAATLFPAGPARTIWGTILREMAINVGVETVSAPFVSQWQHEVGNEYGFKDFAINAGFAAAFGGSFAAVTRGTKPSLQFMWEKMSTNPRISRASQRMAKFMSRFSHLDEGNPFYGIRGIDKGRHKDSLEKAADALQKNETLQAADMKMTEGEFNAIDTKVAASDNAVTKNRKAELKKFQHPKRAAADITPYKIDTLPEQVLRKFDVDKSRVSGRKFTPEEKIMLREAGVRQSKDGTFRAKKPLGELDRRIKSGEATGIRDKSHLDEFRKSRSAPVEAESKAAPKAAAERDASVVDDTLSTEEPVSIDRHREIAEIHESQASIDAENANFQRLLDEDPDRVVVLEGKEMTVRQMMDEFDNDASIQRAMSTCATGGT